MLLHLGAHKTATTHLQHLLRSLQPDLVAQGLDVPYFREMRRNGFPGGFARWQKDGNLLRASPARIRGRFDLLLTGQPRVLVSDENWIGGMGDALAPDPYPDLAGRLERTAPLWRGRVDGVFFAIRNMADCLPSAYAETLRLHPEYVGFERHLAARKAAGGSWLNTLHRLQAVFPDTPVTVWRYEDYRENSLAILQRVTGTDIAELPVVADPPATRSPSTETVEEMEKLASSALQPQRYRDEIRRLEAETTTSGKYRPISSDDVGWFTQRYEEDVQAIRDAPLVEFLDFRVAEPAKSGAQDPRERAGGSDPEPGVRSE